MLAALPAAAAPEVRSPSIVIEVSDRASQLMEPRLMRRLLALEVADVEVPPAPDSGLRPTLYYRVLAGRDGSLRLELWERGVLHGARRVSRGQESAQIKARRIALAAGELARELRQKRIAAAAAAAHKKPAPSSADEPGWPLRARLGVVGGASAAAVGPGDLWLAGPTLSGRVSLDGRTPAQGARLELSFAWLGGGAPGLSTKPGVRWLETSLAPSYAWKLGKSVSFAVGARVGVAAVHFSDAWAVDSIPGENATWSARAGAEPRLGFRLGRMATLELGPDAGVVLRRPLVDGEPGERQQLGGVWLGGSVGVVVGR